MLFNIDKYLLWCSITFFYHELSFEWAMYGQNIVCGLIMRMACCIRTRKDHVLHIWWTWQLASLLHWDHQSLVISQRQPLVVLDGIICLGFLFLSSNSHEHRMKKLLYWQRILKYIEFKPETWTERYNYLSIFTSTQLNYSQQVLWICISPLSL